MLHLQVLSLQARLFDYANKIDLYLQSTCFSVLIYSCILHTHVNEGADFFSNTCVCVVSVFGYPLQVFPCPSNSAGPVVMPYFSVVQEVSKHFAALMLIHCS